MTMPSKLCPHWLPEHFDANKDIPYFARWRMPAIKVFWPNGTPPYLDVVRDVPLIVVREWALSEEKDFHDSDSARGKGFEHANRMKTKWEDMRVRYGFTNSKQFAFEGINEPTAQNHMPEHLVNDYYAAFLLRLRQHGLRGVALNYGVGWPQNLGIGTPVDWTPFGDVYDEIKAGNHLLGLHEYWWHESVKELHSDGRGSKMGGWRWEAGRYLQCPWDVSIVITETGIDEGVVPGTPNLGWRDFYEQQPETYVALLAEYDVEIRKDKRIIAAFIFGHDYNDQKWRPFDTRADHFMNTFLPYVESQVNVPDPEPPVPQPSPYPDWLIDKVDSLQKHPTLHYKARTAPARWVAIHHTASPPDTTVEAIARFHVDTRQWPGIAYHVVVTADGTTYLTNHLSTQSYHVAGHNHEAVAICFVGDATKAPMTVAQIASGKRALAWLLQTLNIKAVNVQGHGDFPNQTTACPGNLPGKQWWKVLLDIPSTPLPPINEVRFHAEEAAREARAGKGQQAHDRLVQFVIPYLRKMEGI